MLGQALKGTRAKSSGRQRASSGPGATCRRSFAPGCIYSKDDRTMTRDEVIKEVSAATDTVTNRAE